MLAGVRSHAVIPEMTMMISEETSHRASPLRSTRNPSTKNGSESLIR